MTDNVQYVLMPEEDGGEVTILETGFITRQNIKNMTFEFGEGEDITDSLNRRSNKLAKERNQQNNLGSNRIGVSRFSCIYPNKTDKSERVVLTDCIIQYRDGVNKPDNNYAEDYVSIGFPVEYISKITKDAKVNSGLTVGPKAGSPEVNGHIWLNCNLDKLSKDDIWIVFKDTNGEEAGAHADIRKVLKDMKKNLQCDIMFNITGSIAGKDPTTPLNLATGHYSISAKPVEVFIITETDIEGPVLVDAEKRKKTSADKTERFMASKALAEYAMKNLNIAA